MRWPGRIPANTSSDDMLMTIDLFPTIAHLIGAELPSHKIDGLDVLPFITGQPGAKNPHDGYAFYYETNQLQSVVSADGRWKLQLPHTYRTLNGKPGGHGGLPAKYEQKKIEQPELYDLKSDIGEASDVASLHPEIVESLQKFATQTRDDLGDALTGAKGTGRREAEKVTK
jgi:arylsulfatase